ncbi:MAG: photosystem II protein, Psb35-related [Spirulinaceae cyanobacterium]
MAIVLSLLVIGWLAAAAIGTQVYFRGEQRKPIHERNWNSEGFEQVAQSVTGQSTDYSDRIPAYEMDAYRAAAVNS